MGSLVPSSSYAAPAEPLWAPAGGGGGSQGAQGAQGTQGAQGAQGANGTNGTNGTNGAQGATGAQGAQGASAGTISVTNLEIPGGTPYDYPLVPSDVGSLITVSTAVGSSGPYTLNFLQAAFPYLGTFFLKNIDDSGSQITITRDNNIPVKGQGVLLPPSLGNNNGFLCIVKRLQNGGMYIY